MDYVRVKREGEGEELECIHPALHATALARREEVSRATGSGDSLMRGVRVEAVDAGGRRTHLLLLARLGEGVPNLPLNRRGVPRSKRRRRPRRATCSPHPHPPPLSRRHSADAPPRPRNAGAASAAAQPQPPAAPAAAAQPQPPAAHAAAQPQPPRLRRRRTHSAHTAATPPTTAHARPRNLRHSRARRFPRAAAARVASVRQEWVGGRIGTSVDWQDEGRRGSVSARRAGTQAVNRARGGVSARTWTTSRPLATSSEIKLWRPPAREDAGRTPQLELRSSAVVMAHETALGKASSSPSVPHTRSNRGCNVKPRRAPRVRLAATTPAPAERPVTFARGTVVACACASPLFAARVCATRPASTNLGSAGGGAG
jgi:pyruvate/2-oxoglutarate dehydrogenase complex dihydrolipoamide acyltransferase (E2) component